MTAPAKWTPGPWSLTTNTAGWGLCVLSDERASIVARVVSRGKGAAAVAEREANARLIAAAPALVEACEDMAALLKGNPGLYVVGVPEAVVLDTKAVLAAALKARAALALARKED